MELGTAGTQVAAAVTTDVTTDATAEAAAEVLDALREAAVLRNRIAAVLRPASLSVDRWRCLAFVAERPDTSMGELLEELAMAAATASRTVDTLVDAGLVLRTIDPTDRRRVLLRASTSGAVLLDQVRVPLAAVGRSS